MDVLLGPVGFSVKVISMTDAQSDDLLLCLFECSLCVVPHTDIFFYCVIFVCGNIHFAVLTEAKTPGDASGIFHIVFLDLVFLRNSHGCRCENHAFYRILFPFVGSDFVIQGISQASGLIAALKSAVSA